jgi:hypothetical protein
VRTRRTGGAPGWRGAPITELEIFRVKTSFALAPDIPRCPTGAWRGAPQPEPHLDFTGQDYPSQNFLRPEDGHYALIIIQMIHFCWVMDELEGQSHCCVC